ncbi:sulfite exporter TauE/SafE family protein [Oceanibaculum pacificum]|uniref:Probable membrane transporter protein n=1 Tax=Oceanibaculum pacificum TaxID=580166 RepID=A0A154VX01_9PROT|nr:sulfite exporter TauE/SafE family protein [Oceanibaculum pacificum]KZD05836.1 hypothetical protein AUP43_02695 [Oceanibaculum pacificum]
MELDFALFVFIGFFAQLVDGALGMAFGVISTSSLIALGTPPAIASAAVHTAEIATTGISGASHIWHRNVNWALFRRLVIPGVIGGVVGAYVLTELPQEIVKPLVTLYLAAMAVMIFLRIAAKLRRRWEIPIPILGSAGAFLDAIGGGGWGPIVTSTLLAKGDEPRWTIGSVNTAEFVITIAISLTFLSQLDLSQHLTVIGGLVLGGALAAPLAGYLVKKLPQRLLLMLVGAVIATLTLVNLVSLFR